VVYVMPVVNMDKGRCFGKRMA